MTPAPAATAAAAARTVDVDQLYRQHAAALYRYAAQLCGDPQLAEDVVQETFLRALRGTVADEAPRAWLYQVATNLVREWRRTRARRDALLGAAPPDSALGEGPVGPERAFEARSRQRAVLAALARLPERDRVALLMRQDGFSHAEIAAAVGTTPKSVGQVLARALTRLSRLLGRDALPEEE